MRRVGLGVMALWIATTLCLLTCSESFLVPPIAVKKPKSSLRTGRSPLKMTFEPMLVDTLRDTLPHASVFISDACFGTGACVEKVMQGMRENVATVPPLPPHPMQWDYGTNLAGVFDRVRDSPLLQAFSDAVMGVSSALPGSEPLPFPQPVEELPSDLEIFVMNTPLEPVYNVLAPVFSNVGYFIHVISQDSDDELFNGYPFNVPALFLWGLSVSAFSSIIVPGQKSAYGPGEYDPVKAEKFYSRRWVLTIGRAFQIVSILGLWGIALLRDKYEDGGKNWYTNQPQRAKEAVTVITKLGTTAIKLGQALSIRTDILSQAYVKELKILQDRVQPFPTSLSRQILKEELDLTEPGEFEAVFKQISDKPVASASIGQVYQATLWDGTVVAVKVQRPDVMENIALDLYLARSLLHICKKPLNLQSNFVALVDEWGMGFVNELDYEMEARNGLRFLEAMEARGLDAVTTPAPIPELCSSKVLVTHWINGERLERSQHDDVGRLCAVALNAYLTMLLDTGLLHCDPHPGNLLRTTDGRLAILDWGMTVEVEPDLQYTLLEYIAHLTTEDFDAIPYDLIKLGFVPPGREEAFTRPGIIEVVTTIMKQLTQGGGPKQIYDRLEAELRDEFGEEVTRDELRLIVSARMKDMAERDAASMVTAAGGEVNVQSVAAKMNELQQNSNFWYAGTLYTREIVLAVLAACCFFVVQKNGCVIFGQE